MLCHQWWTLLRHYTLLPDSTLNKLAVFCRKSGSLECGHTEEERRKTYTRPHGVTFQTRAHNIVTTVRITNLAQMKRIGECDDGDCQGMYQSSAYGVHCTHDISLHCEWLSALGSHSCTLTCTASDWVLWDLTPVPWLPLQVTECSGISLLYSGLHCKWLSALGSHSCTLTCTASDWVLWDLTPVPWLALQGGRKFMYVLCFEHVCIWICSICQNVTSINSFSWVYWPEIASVG
jgi:hypothetical protein